MNKKIIVILLAIVIVFGAFYLYNKKTTDQGLSFVFVSQSGQSLDVSFNNENSTATIAGGQYDGLVFNQTISASGARYENTAESLILWNKGNDITLYENEQVIFEGSIVTDAE